MTTIPIPEGLELPKDAGDTVELTAEFTVDAEAGTLTLISVDGVALGEDVEEAPEAAPEDESIESFVANQRAGRA